VEETVVPRENRRHATSHIIRKGLLYDYDPEQFAGNQMPILVVGTKADLAKTLREKVISRSSSIAEECGADEMNLVR
jgi:hypothetical protein